MKKIRVFLVGIALLLASCSGSPPTTPATPEAVPKTPAAETQFHFQIPMFQQGRAYSLACGGFLQWKKLPPSNMQDTINDALRGELENINFDDLSNEKIFKTRALYERQLQEAVNRLLVEEKSDLSVEKVSISRFELLR